MCPAKGTPYEKDIHNIDFNLPHAARVERGGVVDLAQEPALAT
jgi:hypothetical protein